MQAELPQRIMRLADVPSASAYDQVAALHIGSIHHGLLPMLGLRFLSRLYQAIDRAPKAGVWGAMDGERVVGFLAGCADARKCHLAILTSAGLPLLLRAGGSLVRPAVLRRLPGIVSYPFRRPPAAGAAALAIRAELLAIAVDPTARGRGIGRQLVEVFEHALGSWGVEEKYRVATNAADSDSNQFYRTMGFSARFEIRHGTLTLQVYTKAASPTTHE